MSEQLSKKIIYAHGSLGLPLAVIGYPLSIWIPAHYSGGLGLSLATVGTILMLARLTDVITDPVMGELSDRWRTRMGRRRPWLLIGPPVMMLGVYQLFMPGEGVGLGYFLLWLHHDRLTPSRLGGGIVARLPPAQPGNGRAGNLRAGWLDGRCGGADDCGDPRGWRRQCR